MINWFQTVMYKLSGIAPIMIVVGIWMYSQDVQLLWCVCVIVAGIAASAYALIFIKLCKDKLPLVTISVENMSPNDGVVVAYVVTYLVPLTGIILEDKQWIWIVIAAIGILILFKINTLSFNPILLLKGYHCYRVSLTTGIADCVVISARTRINNKNQITVVQRVNSFLMIDEGGR